MPTVRFINQTPVELIDHVLWSFGEDSTSTEINPPDHYYPPGYFDVSLTAWLTTSQQETKEKQITVPGYLYVDFSYVMDLDSTVQVSFTDLSDSAVIQWDWNFGDGSHSNVKNPVHIYNTLNNYTVTLNVNGGFASASQTIYMLPEADFNYTVVDSTTVNFIDTSIRSPSTWHWDFGDSSSSTVQNPSHVYQIPGVYPVTLTLNGDSTKTKTVDTSLIGVTFTRPDWSPEIVDIISSSVHMARGNTQGIYNAVTESSYGHYYSPANTEWSNLFVEAQPDPTTLSYNNWESAVEAYPPSMVGLIIYMHIISENRYFEMHFTSWTSGSGGGFSYTRYEISIAPTIPVANFSWTASGKRVSFTDLSLHHPTSWDWSWGDSSSDGTTKNPIHYYAGYNTSYPVTLTATNLVGSDSTTGTVLTGSAPTILAQWDASNNTVDTVGGRDATWVGTPQYGPGNNGFNLQSGAYLKISQTQTAIFNFAPNSSFSVSFSMKADAIINDYQVLIVKETSSWGWGVWTRNGELFVKASPADNLFTIGAGLVAGVNYNVVYTYDNGVQAVLVNDIPQTLNLASFPEPNYINQGAGALWFGSYTNGSSYKFTGIIDNIKIYSGLI